MLAISRRDIALASRSPGTPNRLMDVMFMFINVVDSRLNCKILMHCKVVSSVPPIPMVLRRANALASSSAGTSLRLMLNKFRLVNL